jgi:tetratricopeptide (TPR) repeat protein
MIRSDRVLRHLAYFEELARMDQSDPAWRPVSAGLVVLRLVDGWLDQGSRSVTSDGWSMAAARAAVGDIPQGGPIKAILESVLAVLADSSRIDMHALTPRLLAYGQSLEYESAWALAADVYKTVVEHTDPIEDSESAIAAHMRLGFCLRIAGDVDGASDAYRMAGDVAAAVNDMMGVLRSRIGGAKVAIVRGNLPQAEAILDETIVAAAHHGFRAVESTALHDRSLTAGLRGDYEHAIKLAYRALSCADAERERDRLLHDIATSFYRAGIISAARDAYTILSSTAQEQYLRWLSTIHLMAIAADDQMGTLFERYRRELDGRALPPVLRADFELYAGRGYRLFGQFEEAQAWLSRALESARTHGLNQLSFEVDEELSLVSAEQRAAQRQAVRCESAELTDIAFAIKSMRREAGVGA